MKPIETWYLIRGLKNRCDTVTQPLSLAESRHEAFQSATSTAGELSNHEHLTLQLFWGVILLDEGLKQG